MICPECMYLQAASASADSCRASSAAVTRCCEDPATFHLSSPMTCSAFCDIAPQFCKLQSSWSGSTNDLCAHSPCPTSCGRQLHKAALMFRLLGDTVSVLSASRPQTHPYRSSSLRATQTFNCHRAAAVIAVEPEPTLGLAAQDREGCRYICHDYAGKESEQQAVIAHAVF